MLITALMLTAAIDINLDLTSLIRKGEAAQVRGLTCGITTVGYRFTGKPGQSFSYAGDRYEVPSDGQIELIAERSKKSYQIGGKSLPLEVWPLDQFGFRTVPLPVATAGEVRQ